MILDSMQILTDLIKEFGEGEVSLAKYNFMGEIELRLIVKQEHVAHRFTEKEMNACVDAVVFNRIYNQMFKIMKERIRLSG